MRTIRQLHTAVYEPIQDLITYRAMPTHSINYLDPFLLLNHHGPQDYGPHNAGLPFGPHPHRGFETLTFILQGDITHCDSHTGESVIKAGGIQWMTAGSGLVHAEVSSNEFKEKGGREEVLQLWLNLPARLKMTEPRYTGLQRDEIPHLTSDDGRVTLHLISGEWKGTNGPVDSLTGLFTSWVDMAEGGTWQAEVPAGRNILFYVVKGEVTVNGHAAGLHQLVEFTKADGTIEVTANTDATFLFCHGEPYHEPIVARGPFVMNSEAEIREAMLDYQAGKMGSMPH